MLGSIFIHHADPQDLLVLRQDLDALDDFSHVALDHLLTLDFETLLADSGHKWMAATPVFYDEADGIVLAKISAAGLACVLEGRHDLDEDLAADLDGLRAFVRVHGVDDIYELATF